MSWAAPKTFVNGDVLLASELNTYLRDNTLEMCAAKAVTPGGIIVTSAENEVAERVPTASTVSVSESQTGGGATSFADLTTIGPTVTVETGSAAVVFLYGNMYHSAAATSVYMGFAVSGDSSVAASDDQAIRQTNPVQERYSAPCFIKDLSPGMNTFTAKYRIGAAGTGTWAARKMIVFPL